MAAALLAAGVAAVIGLLIAISTTFTRADGAGVLLVIEDSASPGRRADAVVLATWWRSCDEVRLTSIPRDLAVSSDSEVVAVLYETLGARGLATALGDALDTDIAAVVSIDLDDVERIAEAIGPVPIDLPAESLDRRTGFHAGPGRVELTGTIAVDFLRSRTWEERNAAGWTLVESSDLGRIRRAQTYLAAAIDAISSEGAIRQARIGATVLTSATVDVVDPLAFGAIATGAGSPSQIVHDAVEVVAERSDDDRRSPFVPSHLEAWKRLVLAADGPTSIDGCRRSSG